MDVITAVGFLLIGFVGGAFGAMVGLGGATFIIPMATLLLAPNFHHLRAAAMVSNTFVAIGAVLQYSSAAQIDWRIVRRTAPYAMVTVLIGVWVTINIDAALYRGLFGGFLLLVVARELHLLLAPPPEEAAERPLGHAPAAAIGTIAGLASGVLSVGGGVVFVPALREWLRLPVKRAAATSMAMVLPAVAVGAVAQMWFMYRMSDDKGGTMLPGALMIAGFLAPSAMVGGWVGARLNTKLPRTTVAWVMVTALTVAALLLLHPLVRRLTLGSQE